MNACRNLVFKYSKSCVKRYFWENRMATNAQKSIEIDGSYLEGGGQILRISTALSVILGKSIHVVKIRAGRKDGGLKPQHLTGIELLGRISRAKLVGAEIKSTRIEFDPVALESGEFVADTKTAGSVCLMMQNSIPCLIFAKDACELHLRGGTNASNSPPIEYFQLVFLPMARRFGMDIEIELKRRGFYPKGGGEVFCKTKPIKSLKPLDLTEFGVIKRIYGHAFVAGFLPIKIAERMVESAKTELREIVDKSVPIEIDVLKVAEGTYYGAGCGIIVMAETSTGCLLAGSWPGEKGVQAEEVAKRAVSTLIEDLEAKSCVDQYMQDQVIIFMGLACGRSRVRTGELTLHTKTAIHYTQLLTGAKFEITPLDQTKRSFMIECDGIGFENKFI